MTGFVFDLFHHAAPSAPDPRLDQVLDVLATINGNQRKIMATLAEIKAAVAAEHDVVQSAVTLLAKLHTELQTALSNNDLNGMQAILDDIQSNTQALGAAVAANTASAPSPVPAPDPAPEPAPDPAPEPGPPSPAAA